jgi:hypothetical protein
LEFWCRARFDATIALVAPVRTAAPATPLLGKQNHPDIGAVTKIYVDRFGRMRWVADFDPVGSAFRFKTVELEVSKHIRDDFPGGRLIRGQFYLGASGTLAFVIPLAGNTSGDKTFIETVHVFIINARFGIVFGV